MIRAWRSVAYNYREGGVSQLLRKLAHRFKNWMWSEANWLVYTVDPRVYPGAPRLQLERREVGVDQLRQHGYFKAIAFPEFAHRRLADGEHCHGFFIGEDLVNIAWTTDDKLVLESRTWVIDRKGCVGIYDCYTMPAHRSKGIYTDALIRLVLLAREQGATTALIAVDPTNQPSIRAIERSGFVPWGRLTRRRRAGRSSVQRSEFLPLYPGAHLRGDTA
jgi:RimJ/RimL family protein N-acetyltransferase